MDKKDPSEWWYVAPEELKNQFEASPIVKPVIKRSHCGTKGKWDGNIWFYDDAGIQARYVMFCEGFQQGAIRVVTDEHEKNQRQRNMMKQIMETDEAEEFKVININKYRNIDK